MDAEDVRNEAEKAMDDYGNTLDLLADEDGREVRTVDFGKVPVFEGAEADKAQALKVIEEAAELFAAWQAWKKEAHMFGKPQLYDAMVEEAADVVQALANFLAGLGVEDIRRAMADCMERNEQRGRVYAVPELKPCPFCGGKAELMRDHDGTWSVICGERCGVSPATCCYEKREDAVSAWNRRAE